MNKVLDIESTLTDRYQTTVPETVRRVLKLGKRDKLTFSIQSDGTVLLRRAELGNQNDPAMGEFLRFLASDIAARPHAISGLDSALQARLQSLVGSIEVDLDATLTDD